MTGRALSAVGLLVFFFTAPVFAAELSPMVIENGDGKQTRLMVEWALTDEARATGLMHRDSLAENQGMMFDFGSAQPIAMWMKNTLIPLDMLFIDEQGVVRAVARRTIPLSLDRIISPYPARYVLEIGGGVAEKQGIDPGSRVVAPRLGVLRRETGE